MQDLTKKFTELYEQLLVRSTKLTSEKTTVANKAAKVIEDAKANQELLSELEAREKEVKKIEDVVQLNAETTKAYKALISEKKALKKDLDKFEEDKKTHLEENKAESEAISAKNIKLQKAQLALDDERKTYKQKVMKEINDNIEKQKVKI